MSRIQLFWITYVGLGLLATIAELVIPARKLKYGKALPMDLVAFAAYQLLMVPAAYFVTDPIKGYIPVPSLLREIAWPVRFVAYYLLADMGSYWMHRLMHSKHLWRVHRWHHSPVYLYWLAGVRATIPQQILFNLPYVIAFPLLSGGPPWLFAAIVVEGIFRNHWMHLNVTWRSNWIEWIFVTPRYHHIHHSSQPEFHDTNYGSLFAIWDRLFGTYTAPDKVTAPTEFGTGDAPQQGRKKVLAVARLVAGV